ncbi:unnamed protein product [Candidula unifasciata]|uniref:Copine-3 n=1 Tax=Candidula unifasciata TaxID=100452 RepID=A0A8S3YJQ5_9EUPU|nr:unnamed protein product [Candidula unifasciata]
MACPLSPQFTARHQGDQPSSSALDLYFECKNLKDKDILSKSDPCVVLHMSNRAGRLEEVGRTEILTNTLNPTFARPIRVRYNFGDVQRVVIKVYDVDKISELPKEEDLLGQMECTLGQIVANRPYVKPLLAKNNKESGSISIRAIEADEESDTVRLSFWAKNLDKKDVLSQSDPFLEIYKQVPGSNWQLIHRTEVIKDSRNPKWKPITLSVQNLCDGDRSKHIKIDCYDHDDNGKHDFIGGFTTTLTELMKPSSAKSGFACINPALTKKKDYKNSGAVYKSKRERTFLDFVFEGLKINFTVAIDFTQSNGDPRNRDSLHYYSQSVANEYMQAIRSVGSIIQDYDADKLFPAFGFGAKVLPSCDVSHDFPLNFNENNPNCAGIEGVLDAYVKCFQRIELSGPTIVAPVINHVAHWASAAQHKEPTSGAHAYQILLLLTDGIFNDMPETKKAVIHASGLPMSIIIVGVGASDFTEMRELSGDRGLLSLPSGETAKRDIVEFVPFRNFKTRPIEDLARYVLDKIPRQVTDYYKMRGLHPLTQR